MYILLSLSLLFLVVFRSRAEYDSVFLGLSRVYVSCLFCFIVMRDEGQGKSDMIESADLASVSVIEGPIPGGLKS